MKVAIDLTPLFGRKCTGVEMYAIDLYHALMKRGYDVVPIFNEENELDDNPNAYIIRKACCRLWLENVSLSVAARKINADAVLFPIFPPPVDLYWGCKSKIISVIHDTAFKDYRSTLKFAARYYLTPKCNLSLRFADYIVTISNDAKRKIERYTKLPVLNWGENISCDYRPENLRISKEDLNQFGLEVGEYYISVSTIEPRKNLKYLLKAIRETLVNENRKLVLVGRKGWGKDNELNELLQSMQDMIVFTEYIPIATMQSLYHYAFAFALLSLEEGFGRTPLEAIACGCHKIIVSDIPVFHEVLGNCANYVPLNEVEEASTAFLQNSWKVVEESFEVPFEVLERNIYF